MMRRRVLTELVFAIEIGVTILLGVVIYYMASQALAGREQWAIFIAYVGALRMTLNGVTLAIRAFASVSRYYPQIVRYYLFIKDMQKIDKTPLAEVRRGDKVFLGTLPNGQDVVVEVGDRLATLACSLDYASRCLRWSAPSWCGQANPLPRRPSIPPISARPRRGSRSSLATNSSGRRSALPLRSMS